jgi:predicted O-methyltransferase YrrM
MSNKTFTLPDRLYDYLIDHSLREAEVLQRLREETLRMPMARMQIAPEQGQFMQLLVRALGVRRALEVGVFTGYSSLAVALALPADGRLVACDISEEWTAIARRYWQQAGVAERIDLRIAPARETLDGLIGFRLHRCRQGRLCRLLRAGTHSAAPRRAGRDRQYAVVRAGRRPPAAR